MRSEMSIAPRRRASALRANHGPVCMRRGRGLTDGKRGLVLIVCLLLLAVPVGLTGQSQVFRPIQPTPPKADSSPITVTPRRVWRPWRPGPQRVNAKNSTTPWAYVAGASAVLVGALVVNRIVEHKDNAKDWGKRGQITLASETKIGRSSLPPGRYMVQHYADPSLGNEMLFEGKGNSGFVTSDQLQPSKPVLITRCRIIAMEHKATETTVIAVSDGDTPRILSLEIKGEKIAHIITQD